MLWSNAHTNMLIQHTTTQPRIVIVWKLFASDVHTYRFVFDTFVFVTWSSIYSSFVTSINFNSRNGMFPFHPKLIKKIVWIPTFHIQVCREMSLIGMFGRNCGIDLNLPWSFPVERSSAFENTIVPFYSRNYHIRSSPSGVSLLDNSSDVCEFRSCLNVTAGA